MLNYLTGLATGLVLGLLFAWGVIVYAFKDWY